MLKTRRPPQLLSEDAWIPLVLPGFPAWPSYGQLLCYSPTNASAAAMFQTFSAKIAASVGNRYFPVYRMADGEFSLLVGWRPPVGGRPSLTQRLRWFAHRVVDRAGLRGQRTIWGEGYDAIQVRQARARLLSLLPQIAEHGVLAPYLMRRADRWGEQYLEPVVETLAQAKIPLTADNYIPFYLVYALLTTPVFDQLVASRTIGVVTHLTQARKTAITQGLCALGATAVQFAPVSSNNAMFDSVNIGLLQKCELVLVAAGVGSINVLAQLRPLGVPAIDSGIVLEAFSNPSRRTERPFLLRES